MQKYMNEGNVVASPLSIAGALHMLAAGAAGDTRYQICEKGLGLDPEIFGTRKGVSHKESIFSFRSLIEDDIDVDSRLFGMTRTRVVILIFKILTPKLFLTY